VCTLAKKERENVSIIRQPVSQSLLLGDMHIPLTSIGMLCPSQFLVYI